MFNLYSSKGIEKVVVEFNARDEKLLKTSYHNKGFFKKSITNERVASANALIMKQLKNFGFEDPSTILVTEVR